MSHYYPPRVLDASALIELFNGHPMLMQLLDLAEAGKMLIGMPAAAIAEAHAVLDVRVELWHEFLRFPGLVDLPMAAHGALEVGALARTRPIGGALTSRLQVGHVLQEAYAMGAIIVTGIPHAYSEHPGLVVHALDGPSQPT